MTRRSKTPARRPQQRRRTQSNTIARRPQQIRRPQQTEFSNENKVETFQSDMLTMTYDGRLIIDPNDREGFLELYDKRDISQTKWTNGCNWKLHIEYNSPTQGIFDTKEEALEYRNKNTYAGDPLYDFLFEKGYDWKPDTFTIYVGSKDEAEEVADELIEKFGEYLESKDYSQPLDLIPQDGDDGNIYIYGDTPFDTEGKITGRFCGHGTDYAETARGFLGLPFLKSFSDELEELVIGDIADWYLRPAAVEKYGSEQNAIIELTKTLDNIHGYLEDEFGEFFTGTDENREIGYHPGSLDEFLTIKGEI